MADKRALITGITGQDGSYLAELLLGKGYEVHGIVRRSSTTTRERIEHLHRLVEARQSALRLHYADMLDTGSLVKVVEQVQPDEVYNLAAQSHVRISFDVPELTYEVTGMGAFRMLEAVRRAAPEARVYQAGSSEMFGSAGGDYQDESTPFRPRSPYGIAKVFAHHTAVHYREAYGLFVANGIMFNHESPRRGENFVTRKVARAAARISRGLEKELRLGALDARRDWGYAPEYVEAMWLMLQQERPDDYVIATGEAHTVEEFVAAAFEVVGLDWRYFVVHDAQYDRPTEVHFLRGNAAKARRELGWAPRTTFAGLVRLMVQAELDAQPH
ncbi:MAG TPA: GDP-mannose 4,6-dehydratase [Dehalococcoidia bacterium]|nr:GDP-mannose 4,6-dehydratase [Dehalococcoidia bacterium]